MATHLVPFPFRRRRDGGGVFAPFGELQREINEAFEDVWKDFDLMPFKGARRLADVVPTTDVTETDAEIVVTVELPGIDEKDVDVTVSEDRLTIKGEKKAEKEEKEKNYYMMERTYGAFQRSIVLPDEADSDKANATFENGVLTVTIPKTEKAKEAVKKIAIHAK